MHIRSREDVARDMLLALRYPPGQIPRVTHLRSTGIAACLHLLDARGLRGAYDANLAADTRAGLAALVPATWVDASLGLAHMNAVDALGLTPAELHALGAAAGAPIQSYLTGSIVRMRRALGVTPWALMPHSQRLWDRMVRGGDLTVERTGPKEVVVTLHELPFARSRYFRVMMQSVFQLGLAMWCRRCFVTEIDGTSTSVSFREAWV